jgi:intracellular sulfur oxidation DsrE/DsrF family protein
MGRLIFLFLLLLQSGMLSAQSGIPPHLEGRVSYPVLDFDPWVGVISTDVQALGYNPSLEYKVAVDVYGKVRDSTAVFGSFTEVGRTFNLLAANGTPKEKIKMAAVIHGGAVIAILTDEEYQKKYGVPNPSLPVIAKLKEAGIEFYVCGQNLGMFDLRSDQITSDVKVALSAKTTFITLDQLGYSFLDVGGN